MCDDVGGRLDNKVEFLRYCENELDIKWDVFSLENTNVNEVFERATEFSIFFIHKDMKHINGIEFAMNIRSRNKNALIIIMTEDIENVLQALDVVVFHVLVEPISKKAFYVMLRRAIIYTEFDKNFFRGHLFREKFSIEQDKIILFEKDKRKVRIYTLFGIRVCYMTAEEILAQLNMKLFARCHQSYIVNFEYVKKLGTDSLELHNGREVDISRTYKQNFRKEYFNYISKKS